jgi:phage-related protein
MAACKCLYFVTESGRCPVKDFIDSLDLRAKRKFFYEKELLEQYGTALGYPHTKYLGNSIHELRFEGGEGAVRVLYFFYNGENIIFTNGFVKKTDKTPKQELELAWQRRKKFLLIRGVVR